MLDSVITEDVFSGLSDTLKAEYTKQSDGKYLLQVKAVGGFALENVEQLKNALAAARTEREAAKAAAKAFEGLDAEAARDALRKLEEMKDWTPDQKVKERVEAAIREIKAKAETDLKVEKTRTQQYLDQLDSYLVDSTAREALGKHKLVDGGGDLLMPHIRGAVVIKEVEGRRVARIKGDNGTDRVSMKQGSTDPMGVEEFVELMAHDARYKAVFAAPAKSGSQGTAAGGGRQTGGPPVGTASGEGNTAPMSPVNRLAAARAASSNAG